MTRAWAAAGSPVAQETTASVRTGMRRDMCAQNTDPGRLLRPPAGRRSSFAPMLEGLMQHDHPLTLDDVLRPVEPTFETIERRFDLGEDYEALLADAPDTPFDWPELDDRAAAGLCYTSGTTGNPKGVLYSHRSNLLHAIGKCLADGE